MVVFNEKFGVCKYHLTVVPAKPFSGKASIVNPSRKFSLTLSNFYLGGGTFTVKVQDQGPLLSNFYLSIYVVIYLSEEVRPSTTLTSLNSLVPSQPQERPSQGYN